MRRGYQNLAYLPFASRSIDLMVADLDRIVKSLDVRRTSSARHRVPIDLGTEQSRNGGHDAEFAEAWSIDGGCAAE